MPKKKSTATKQSQTVKLLRDIKESLEVLIGAMETPQNALQKELATPARLAKYRKQLAYIRGRTQGTLHFLHNGNRTTAVVQKDFRPEPSRTSGRNFRERLIRGQLRQAPSDSPRRGITCFQPGSWITARLPAMKSDRHGPCPVDRRRRANR